MTEVEPRVSFNVDTRYAPAYHLDPPPIGLSLPWSAKVRMTPLAIETENPGWLRELAAIVGHAADALEQALNEAEDRRLEGRTTYGELAPVALAAEAEAHPATATLLTESDDDAEDEPL